MTFETTIAAALAIALSFAAPATAQTMTQGYDMLTAALAGEFDRLGIDQSNLDGLTLGQIAAINSIVNSPNSDAETRSRVEAIISDRTARPSG